MSRITFISLQLSLLCCQWPFISLHELAVVRRTLLSRMTAHELFHCSCVTNCNFTASLTMNVSGPISLPECCFFKSVSVVAEFLFLCGCQGSWKFLRELSHCFSFVGEPQTFATFRVSCWVIFSEGAKHLCEFPLGNWILHSFSSGLISVQTGSCASLRVKT